MKQTKITEEAEPVFDEEIDLFIKHISSGEIASDQTIRAYRSDLEHFQNYLQKHGVKRSSDIDPETLHEYFSHLQEDGYKNSTLVRKLASIRSFFDLLVKNKNQFDQNPTRKMDYPKITKRLPTVLDQNQMEALLNAPDASTLTGKRNLTILELIYSTGMRASELQQLDIENLDQMGKTIRIDGKGNKQRIVPVGQEAIEAVQSYLRAWKQAGRIRSGTSGPLICNKFGQRLSTRSIRRAVTREAEKAGLSDDVSPHTLRHTFATHMLQNGADLRTLQEILGHENLHTTEIYTHITDGEMKESYDLANPLSN